MSFASMRGRTLYVGNLNGESIGIDFSDGTIQTTAYQGTTSGGTIPNQLTITNSTNSTSVVISAGQDSSGNLTDDSIYYTALNSTETSPTLTHNFVGSTVNLNTSLNVSGAAALDSTLTVSGATTLGSTSTESSTMLNVYGNVYQYLENNNTQYGYQALSSGSLTGGSNTAVGFLSLENNTTGNYNCAVGDYSLASNTSGYQNTAVGHWSQIYNTTGYQNTSIGNDSLQTNTDGYNNTCVGASAGFSITDGYNNTCVGVGTGTSISDGNNNTCLGANSNITDGAINSTVIGAGVSTATSNQIVLGTSSNSTSIPGSTVIGSSASNTTVLTVEGKIYQQMLNGNTSLGYASLAAQTSTTTGSQNTSVGYQSLSGNTSGYQNTSVGYDALISCTSGYGNTAFGAGTLGYLNSGYGNTCIGSGVGQSITEGNYNTCLGAGSNITDGAINSTVIGAGATTANSNQIVLGTSSSSTSIPGSLSVAGTSTFTSGFACGNQTTPYIMLIGTASVSYGGNEINAYVSDSQDTCILSSCTLNNSMSFPTTIVGGYVNSNNEYVWANFAGIAGISTPTNTFYASFVNFGQSNNYIPSTVSFILFGN
jgi:hypothetical protein